MRIQRLKLHDYRNYHSLCFEPGPGVNVIAGANAQGKTNAVEAIFLCALLRSHRTPRDAELIREGQPGGYAGALVQSQSGTHEIEIKLRAGERKRMVYDGAPAARSVEMMGRLNVVMFSPEDLALVKGGPEQRRRFMDMELCQLYPAYFSALQQYGRALKQRNALLKDGGGPLFMWDEQLALCGGVIMRRRAELMQRVQRLALNAALAMTGGEESLRVEYRPFMEMPENGNTSLEERLREALSASAREDLRRGFTTVGPHRDDISLHLLGRDVRVYGSQGQQRTAALCVKLSELTLMEELLGEPPVLLLDDALSELDGVRGRLLLESMRRCQCFLTCTGVEGVRQAGLSEYDLWRCRDGGPQTGAALEKE